MRYLLCDTADKKLIEDIKNLQTENFVVIDSKKPIAKCTGCFKCWLKNTGRCAFSDNMEFIGKKLLTSEEMIIVCEALYGGLSINIKRIVDRIIPAVLPFFTLVNNELHHQQRFIEQTEIKVIFTNGKDLSQEEKDHSKKIIEAMAVNFHAKKNQVIFVSSSEEVIQEVEK